MKRRLSCWNPFKGQGRRWRPVTNLSLMSLMLSKKKRKILRMIKRRYKSSLIPFLISLLRLFGKIREFSSNRRWEAHHLSCLLSFHLKNWPKNMQKSMKFQWNSKIFPRNRCKKWENKCNFCRTKRWESVSLVLFPTWDKIPWWANKNRLVVTMIKAWATMIQMTPMTVSNSSTEMPVASWWSQRRPIDISVRNSMEKALQKTRFKSARGASCRI